MPEYSEGGQPRSIDTKTSLLEDNRPKRSARRLISHILPANLFRRKKQDVNESPIADHPLPEKLQFIRKHVDVVSADHVQSIFRTPGYNILTPYFGLKIFGEQPERQMEMLSTITNALAETGDYTEAGKAASIQLTTLQETDPTLTPVSPK